MMRKEEDRNGLSFSHAFPVPSFLLISRPQMQVSRQERMEKCLISFHLSFSQLPSRASGSASPARRSSAPRPGGRRRKTPSILRISFDIMKLGLAKSCLMRWESVSCLAPAGSPRQCCLTSHGHLATHASPMCVFCFSPADRQQHLSLGGALVCAFVLLVFGWLDASQSCTAPVNPARPYRVFCGRTLCTDKTWPRPCFTQSLCFTGGPLSLKLPNTGLYTYI